MSTKLVSLVTVSSQDQKSTSVLDATGDYDITTNPNGWGIPNATRDQFWVAHFLSKLSPTSPDILNIASTNPSYDGQVSTSPDTFVLTGDGVYRVDSIAFPIGIPTGTFAPGTVWKNVGGTNYLYKTIAQDTIEGAIRITNITELFAPPYPLISGNFSAYILQINGLLICRARKGLQLLLDRNCDINIYNKYLRLYAKTIAIQDCMLIEEYYTAAKSIDELTKLLCDC